jgi:predicted MFS family arabinose efflux permease
MTTITDYLPHWRLPKAVFIVLGLMTFAVIVLCFYLALTTGVVHRHGKDYKRDEQPLAYWSIVSGLGLIISFVSGIFIVYFFGGKR